MSTARLHARSLQLSTLRERFPSSGAAMEERHDRLVHRHGWLPHRRDRRAHSCGWLLHRRDRRVHSCGWLLHRHD